MIECRRISTFSCCASSAALRSGRTLKPMMMAFDAVASSTSLSVMEPTPEWMHLDAHLLRRHADQRVGQHFHRSGHVALDDQRQVLHAGLANLLRQSFQRDARALGQLRLALLHLAVLRNALGLVAIGDHQERVAGVGHGFEAQHFDRRRRAGFFNARGRDRRTWREPCRRCCRRCSCRSAAGFRPAPARWPRRRGRDRAWLRCTEPTALRPGVALGALMSRDQADHFQQQIEIHALLGRDLDEDRAFAARAAHSSGIRPRSASCFFTRSGLASGLSILFTATMMGTSAALA